MCTDIEMCATHMKYGSITYSPAGLKNLRHLKGICFAAPSRVEDQQCDGYQVMD